MMKIPFASHTANSLVFRLDDTTPMERAFARQHMLDRLGTALEAGCRSVKFTVGRFDHMSGLISKRVLTYSKTVEVEFCWFVCPACRVVRSAAFGGEKVERRWLPWALVNDRLDGGPECPNCSAPYWEEWRRVLWGIASQAVAQCYVEAEVISNESGCTVESILDTFQMSWNPASVYPRPKIDRRFVM